MTLLEEIINKGIEETIKEETNKNVKDLLEQIIYLLDNPNWSKEDVSKRLKTYIKEKEL